MNLNLFENLGSDFSAGIKDFINELANSLAQNMPKDNEVTANMERVSDNLKQEGCLYQVVEVTGNSAYLYNASTGITSKEADISEELLKSIGTDYILKYTNGEYVFDQKETSNFFDSMVGIGEYSKIKEQFSSESGISEIDTNTVYTVKSRDEDKTVLAYGNNNANTIEAPNQLIPYFAKTGTHLLYENKTFKIDFDS